VVYLGSHINVVYSDEHWLHSDPGGTHPENPNRLEEALATLKSSTVWSTTRLYYEESLDESVLLLVHDREYVEWIKRECSRGFHYIDSDTYVTRHTYRVAARYSTLAYIATHKGFEEKEMWILLPRPPGHHAGRRGVALGAPTQGFCIFNHSAVAAKSLLEKTRKVLVIDFDAHHGNGTQEIFWNEPHVIHVDIHQHGIYPGTGWVSDSGSGEAVGTKINIPLPPYAGDEVYVWVLEKIVKPLNKQYSFEAVVVSAGFDSYAGDPLTQLNVTEAAYEAIALYLYELFKEKRVRTIISILEGGYGRGLREGFKAYVEALAGKRAKRRIKGKPPSSRVYRELREVLSKYHGIEL